MMRNKRADITFRLAILITSVLAFMLILNFLVKTSDITSTSIEDAACNALVKFKSNDIVKAASFFKQIRHKCVVEKIESKAESKEEVYREIGNFMNRCWYRFGEGEYDFMENFDTSGNWCFSCAEIEFKSEKVKGKVYSYNDFISWLEKEKYRNKEGKLVSYAENLNLKYTDVSSRELKDLKKVIDDIDNLREEEDQDYLVYMSLFLRDNYQYLQDLKLKRINTNEKVYVVYRYDRADSNLQEVVEKSVEGFVGAATTSAVISAGTSVLLGTIVSGPVGLVVGSVKLVKVLRDMHKAQEVAERFYSGVNIVSKVLKFTKKSTVVTGAVGVSAGVVGGYVEANSNLGYSQYVDLMTQEQYFRSCGTKSFGK